MKTAALLLLIIASSMAYAAPQEPDAESLTGAMTRASSLLAARSDPDSLAAAALFIAITDAAQAEQLAGRASAAAPKRPELLWLHAQLCKDVPGCNRKPIDAKLRALDPSNGATFLPALQEVGPDSDPASADRLIAAVAKSKRIDFYWNPLIAHLSSAVITTRTLAPGPAVIAVIGAASAVVIPPVAGASLPCRDWIPRQERRAECRSIARAFLQGDTAVAEAAGQNLTEALWAPDSPEARAAKEARRVLVYQVSTNGKAAATRLGDEAGVQRYLDKLARYRREREVIVAELAEAGLSATPPADWRASPPPAPPSNDAFAPAAR
jgi:hypothetical protein